MLSRISACPRPPVQEYKNGRPPAGTPWYHWASTGGRPYGKIVLKLHVQSSIALAGRTPPGGQPDRQKSCCQQDHTWKELFLRRNPRKHFCHGSENKSKDSQVSGVRVHRHGIFQRFCRQHSPNKQPNPKGHQNAKITGADRLHHPLIQPHEQEQIGDADPRQD